MGQRSRSVTFTVLFQKTEVFSIGYSDLPNQHFRKHQQVEFRVMSGQTGYVCFKRDLDFFFFPLSVEMNALETLL